LNKNLKFLLKNTELPLKSFKMIKKNSSGKNYKNDFKKFFTKKNLKLIEQKESYLFKKFYYKKISDQKS